MANTGLLASRTPPRQFTDEAGQAGTNPWDRIGATRNKIGAENIGLFDIPLLKGGKGTAGDVPMNAGLITTFSQAQYDATEGDWRC